MNRSTFSEGKPVWRVACADCNNFKGYCKCPDSKPIIFGNGDKFYRDNLFAAMGLDYVTEMENLRLERTIGYNLDYVSVARRLVRIDVGNDPLFTLEEKPDPEEWIEDLQ